MPMGDQNGVCIAQATHEAILEESNCMRPAERLQYGAPVPLGSTWEGLYIDDHIVIQKYSRERRRSRVLRDEEIMRSSRAHYVALNVPTSSKKAFTFKPKFVAWGTSVDSASGRVGTPLAKLRHLLQATVEFCALRSCTKKLLQRLVGLFVHPFSHRRELMCVFSRVYGQIEQLPERKQGHLTAVCKQELRWAALLLPFAHSNIRWPLSPRVSATDATPTGVGRAAAFMPERLVEVAYRYGVHRGEFVRLDWSEGRLAPSTELTSAPTELEHALECGRWRVTERSKFSTKAHINVQELKVIVKELRHLTRKSSAGQRCVNLCDSRVVVGAFGKGRSSAVRLNHWLRRAMIHCVAGSKALTNVWVSTKADPSDHPSRGAKIPINTQLTDELKLLLSPSEQAAMLPPSAQA